MTSAGKTRRVLHEVRASRDEGSWNVTLPRVFFIGRELPFVACMSIGGQATNGMVRPSAKCAGTHEDL